VGVLDGKVAFITGAAHGQGRSHALTLAGAGADIIAIDLCENLDSISYAQGTPEELAETVELVEKLDRRIIATKADVRDLAAVKKAVDDGVAELGRLDIVLASAGVISLAPADEVTEEMWDVVVDTNMGGVFKTVLASIPHLKANKNGGSIVLTSSNAGEKGLGNLVHYVAAKHGVVGMMKTLAVELGPFNIRVNSVLPTATNTVLLQNQEMYSAFRPDITDREANRDDFAEAARTLHVLPIPWVQPQDISNAILFLVSDAARYVTGAELPVDAGSLVK
jgi:SDR family mycofactocin-dependent oxidoreductase